MTRNMARIPLDAGRLHAPLSPSTQIGPMINAAAVQRVSELLEKPAGQVYPGLEEATCHADRRRRLQNRHVMGERDLEGR